jgi:hypothetical protein
MVRQRASLKRLLIHDLRGSKVTETAARTDEGAPGAPPKPKAKIPAPGIKGQQLALELIGGTGRKFRIAGYRHSVDALLLVGAGKILREHLRKIGRSIVEWKCPVGREVSHNDMDGLFRRWHVIGRRVSGARRKKQSSNDPSNYVVLSL